MCGIIGAITPRNAIPLLIAGLERLEYRGYDSAGLAYLDNATIKAEKNLGKVKELKNSVSKSNLSANLGIAHTRWATHGKPSTKNAHPHLHADEIAIVHNGIIENHAELKQILTESGYEFVSQTDSEVIAHLIHKEIQSNSDPIQALQQTAKQLKGAYAIAVIFKTQPEELFAIRHNSPMIIGVGIDENFVASDSLALSNITDKFIVMHDDDIARISRKDITIFSNGKQVERAIEQRRLSEKSASKGDYKHFMQKEIFEQIEVVYSIMENRFADDKFLASSFGSNAENIFSQVKHIQIVACGTSYHAGLIGRYFLESLTNIPCSVEVASEFRYRKKAIVNNSLLVVISQSGETADTLAALKNAQGFLATLAICNVPHSSIVNLADLVLLTQAGPEIGVASTKAFTSQLIALIMLTLAVGEANGMDNNLTKDIVNDLHNLPNVLEQALALDKEIKKLATSFADKNHSLFLGRGALYPVAKEGALKLKEISYIHAEAYPAGELKHGPLALVDANMPVIAVAPSNELLEKLCSNLAEVSARGGKLIVFADSKAKSVVGTKDITIIETPHVSDLLAPIVYTIPLQLLAYHVAVLKGTDVDQPRNLAKSVTVE